MNFFYIFSLTTVFFLLNWLINCDVYKYCIFFYLFLLSCNLCLIAYKYTLFEAEAYSYDRIHYSILIFITKEKLKCQLIIFNIFKKMYNDIIFFFKLIFWFLWLISKQIYHKKYPN